MTIMENSKTMMTNMGTSMVMSRPRKGDEHPRMPKSIITWIDSYSAGKTETGW